MVTLDRCVCILSLNVDALQVRTDDWERPARVLQALHLTQVRYPGACTLLVANWPPLLLPLGPKMKRRVLSCVEILFHTLRGRPKVVHRVGRDRV